MIRDNDGVGASKKFKHKSESSLRGEECSGGGGRVSLEGERGGAGRTKRHGQTCMVDC
jgi:hypothetical protein